MSQEIWGSEYEEMSCVVLEERPIDQELSHRTGTLGHRHAEDILQSQDVRERMAG